MPRRPKSSSSTPTNRGQDSERSSAQRLQRVLAAAGFGSRRQCEELIEQGRIHVDGEVVTKLGVTVDPQTAKILVDGVLLKRQKLVYYAVNKPVGVVTTNSDPEGRPRVVDLVPPSERVFPVGRLDRSSEGLILLTNDGDLAQRLAHPKFGIQKVYRVTVAGKVDVATLKQMREGIYIAEGHVRVDGARVLSARAKSTEMEITLREGKNREIRRILARLGHKVQTLRRIAVGPLRLADTPPGAYRPLTREEVSKLHQATIEAERASKAGKVADPDAAARPRKKRPGAKRTSAAGTDRDTLPTRSKRSAAPSKRAGERSSSTPRSSVRPKPTAAESRSRGAATARPKAGDRKSSGIVIRKDGDAPLGVVIGADPKPKRDRPKADRPKPDRSKADRPKPARAKRATSRSSEERGSTTRSAGPRDATQGASRRKMVGRKATSARSAPSASRPVKKRKP